MDRAHLAPHKVHVYTSAKALDDGEKPRVESLVPYPSRGFDDYQVDGVMYPGYVDRNGGDAAVFLNDPLFKEKQHGPALHHLPQTGHPGPERR